MVIVFDSTCLLCNGWVKFILPRDRLGKIQFASMQGKTGKALLAQAGLPTEGLDTLLVVDGEQSWQHTAAILKVLGTLGGAWRLANVIRVVPEGLRDRLYRKIAKNRYRLFGKSNQCLMPQPAYAQRFLP